MLEQGAELELRDLGAKPLSESELEALIGHRDYRQFLNSRNELYRERKMSEHPPIRAEAIRLMARDPNLIRRPVVISGGRIVLGYQEEALRGIAAGAGARKPEKKKAR